jgi:hypothetical protein
MYSHCLGCHNPRATGIYLAFPLLWTGKWHKGYSFFITRWHLI